MFCSLLTRCIIPCGCHAKRHLNVEKCSEPLSLFFPLLTPTCASRQNGVHFFNISTSKSAPRLRCFVHFDFAMCFAPQRRALFRHLNFQKWSETVSILTLLTSKRASRHNGVHFSTSQFPNVLRAWYVLYILTSKCASRHNGVQLFISYLGKWLRTRRFSKPTFRSSRATNHWKNIVIRIRDFSTFSCTCIFFLLTLSLSDLLSSALLFSESSHLCFSICPRCRKFDF